MNSARLGDSTEVFVIGGGPAGLAAAIASRLQGFHVTVADGANPPIDKACGENLMPDAIPALERLGIGFAENECHRLQGVRFFSSGLSAEARFPSRCAVGVRRTTLHRLMIERAAGLGIDLLWGTPVTGIERERVCLGERTIGAKWIIGADGGNSRVRRWAGLDTSRPRNIRYGFRRHYRIAPWTNLIELYWARHAQGYVAYVTEDQVCIGLMSRDPRLRADEALRCFPALEARLRGAEIVSKERGALSVTRKLKRVYRGNVALIGDASGTVDVITGEGLGLAFSQAIVLANCLRSEQLKLYQLEHRRLMMRPSLMARLMLMMDGRSGLQKRALTVFHKRPELFRRLLALHVGEVSPRDLALDGLSFGWGLLTA
ncbi:MAG: NAD(P)/FAD-dependent oxidoreductase [Candidatus Sulfotelmatobacter sp.]